ncbi:MAG TPA: response regulator [Bacteroidales bacterium]|nr:response regulator [Bacteroidales bacterium]
MAKPGRVIYCVDDDPMFQRLLALALQEDHPGLRFFAAGEPFLEQLSKGGNPDLVVLDYHLGSMNGLDILRYLRAVHPEIRVIVLSAQEDIEVAVNALKAGAFDYIVKDARALGNLKRSICQLEEVDSGFLAYNL